MAPTKLQYISCIERINGMGEADTMGSYIKIVCLESGNAPQYLEFSISEGAAGLLAKEIRDLCGY